MSASTRHESSVRGTRHKIVTPHQLAITGIGSLLTFAWYASPDFFTEKKPRAWVRLGIIPALTALTALVARDTVTAVRDDIASESPDQEAWEMTSDNVKFDPKNLDWRVLMLLGAFGTVLLGCSIWFEFWLFRWESVRLCVVNQIARCKRTDSQRRFEKPLPRNLKQLPELPQARTEISDPSGQWCRFFLLPAP